MAHSAARAESTAARWGRRAVSIPLYATLFLAAVALVPVWLPLGLLLDPLTSPPRLRLAFPRLRMMGFFLVYLWLELAGVAAASVLWLRFRTPAEIVTANAALQRWWTAWLFAGARATLGFRVVMEPSVAAGGDDPPARGPFLLFVRHSSTADTILAAALVANPHHILLRYVLKRELLWDPCLDVVGQRLPNVFVDRTGARREAEIAAIAALAVGLDARSAALIYPEGTRFSREKLAAADARLAQRPELSEWVGRFTHVLPPRLGGPLALLDAAPGVDVVILEHTGFEAAASFGDLWAGGLVDQVVRARLRRIPAAEIPEGRAAREQWLLRTWSEVDRWVGEHPR